MEEKEHETRRLLLGAFAMDIRNDWSWGVEYRIKLMRELMNDLNVNHEIDVEACIDDGRWMRNHWTGGYWSDIGDRGWILENLDMEMIDLFFGELHCPDAELEAAVEIYRSRLRNNK